MATGGDSRSAPQAAAEAPAASSAVSGASISDVGLSPEMPLIPPVVTRGNAGWLGSILAALTLHIGFAVFVSWPRALTTLGADGASLDALSIDVISASALQSQITTPAVGSASSLAALADREGTERQQQAASDAPDQKQEAKPDTPAKAADLVIPDLHSKPEPPVPTEATIVIAPAKAEAAAVVADTPTEAKPTPQATAAAAPSRASDAQTAEDIGGALARGVSPVTVAAQSAAIARTGELNAYGTSVRQSVAQNAARVPRVSRLVNPVKVEFALGFDGTIVRARIISSSGDAALDRAALDAVRTAKFPSPPAGMQLKELEYFIEFQ